MFFSVHRPVVVAETVVMVFLLLLLLMMTMLLFFPVNFINKEVYNRFLLRFSKTLQG